jgi:hypothetical protein
MVGVAATASWEASSLSTWAILLRACTARPHHLPRRTTSTSIACDFDLTLLLPVHHHVEVHNSMVMYDQEGDARSQARGALWTQTRGLGQVPIHRLVGFVRVHRIQDLGLAASSSYISTRRQ